MNECIKDFQCWCHATPDRKEYKKQEGYSCCAKCNAGAIYRQFDEPDIISRDEKDGSDSWLNEPWSEEELKCLIELDGDDFVEWK